MVADTVSSVDLVVLLKDALRSKLNYKATDYKKFILKLQEIVDRGSWDEFYPYLCAVNKCVSFLTRDFLQVVEMALSFNWFPATESFYAAEYCAFVTNLVSIHPFYIHTILKSLVDNLLFKEELLHTDCFSYDIVHELLIKVCKITPSALSFVGACINESFPHVSLPLVHQKCFIENIILVCGYLPSLKFSLLEIIVEKLLEMDLVTKENEHVPVSEQQTDEIAPEVVVHVKAFDAERPLSSSSMESIQAQLEESDENTIAKFDASFYLLLEYLQDLHQNPDHLALEETFNHILAVYDRLILKTFKSKYVQMIMLYLTSLEPAFCETFLGMLMSNLMSSSTTTRTEMCKCLSIMHIASFVSRASFLDEHCVRWCFSLLIEWCDNYLTSYEESVCVVEKHAAFYSVSQAIFYIFCFRHEMLLQNVEAKIKIQMSLTKIISSVLNPLKICNNSVVNEFARICSTYELAYCYGIMEKNKSVIMPPISCSELFNLFPFDPISLYLCSKFIPSSLFIQWVTEDEVQNVEPLQLFDSYDAQLDFPRLPNDNLYLHQNAQIRASSDDCTSNSVLPLNISLHRSASYLLLNFRNDTFDDDFVSC